MQFCNHCKKECEEITYDDSFNYSGTHCTGGLDGTHHESHKASDCCDYTVEDDGIWVMCQCGEEREIHPDTEIEWLKCDACKRVGKWDKEY